MRGNLSCNIKCLILSLLLITSIGSSLVAQTTEIHGIINQYGHVNSIGTDYVTVNNPVQFANFQADDFVLLIQMKGISMSSAEDSFFGDGNIIGKPGSHEFLIVESVEFATKKITFTSEINTAFDLSYVQLVKVPYFNNALVTSKLECAVWDSISRTGGVLAAIVGNTLSLNANIDVTGKGFKGGNVSTGKGICIETDEQKWYKYAYSALFDSAGFKGEGLSTVGDTGNLPYVRLYPEYARGLGKNYNGGGGGNGKYSGGGGGSNLGEGGWGGFELSNTCIGKKGGIGGISIPFPGLFLGGGGGASTYLTSGATPGGYGGGIVIIICDTLKANGYSILANGEPAAGASGGTAGAGGGGGGGSIALYLQSYSANIATSALFIKANGGKGGDNLGQTFGEGGGGGGGLITTNNITIPANVNKTVSGGSAGTKLNSQDPAKAGSLGSTISTFKPVLNGFLFNSISSSVTGNLVDSICLNVTPKTIKGTIPIGTGPYIYLWQKSYNLSGPPSVIGGAATKDLIFSAPETNTFWVRRVVTDNGALPDAITDTSKWVNIIVQPEITGNLVGNSTTICYGQNPLSLIPLNSGPSNGNGHYTYQWVQNNDNVWPVSTNADGISTLPSYDPPGLTGNKYYKRIVTSGRCVDNSPTVAITVLPLITGNKTIRPDSVICEGSLFNVLGATVPANGAGAGSYTYLWQDSISTNTWQAASGSFNNPTYTPDTADFAIVEHRFYRRVVYSGPNDVCHSRSNPIQMTRWHKIKNNTIAAPANLICSGGVPLPLTGTVPVNGAGVYSYEWQDSSKTATWTTKYTTGTPYQPVALTDATWFRRIINSSVCTNNSNIVKVTVQPGISNNTISLKSGFIDSTICSGATPNRLLGKTPPALAGGDGYVYTYRWKISLDGTSFSNIAGATASDYQEPLSLTTSKWYQRVAVSGMCKDSTNSLKINVLPALVNTIPALKDVCINTPSPTTPPIVSLSLSGGRTNHYKFLWESSLNGTAWTNVTPDTIRKSSGADLDLPGLSVPTKYRRKVWSGPYNTCFSASNITDITIIQKPYPVFAGRDTTINSFEYLYKLQASEPVLGQGTWSVKTSPNNLTFDDPSQYKTTVRNLALFDPNVLLWTVENGVCKLDATVTVVVMNIEIPDGISPNEDGKNDLMIIKGLDFSKDGERGKPSQSIDLKILNSAGTQVFHTTNDGEVWKTWDGKDDGGIDLPEGTYYYLLKIKSNRSDIKFKPRTGFIILKRK